MDSLWIFAVLLLDVLHLSTTIRVYHHDKPEETHLSVMSAPFDDSDDENATLSPLERHKRLLPYANFYMMPPYNQEQYKLPYMEIEEFFREKQNRDYIIRNRPQKPSPPRRGPSKKIHQEPIYPKYTPFLDSNAIPGPFTPIRNRPRINDDPLDSAGPFEDEIPDHEKEPKVKNDIPDIIAIYEKLTELKLAQERLNRIPPRVLTQTIVISPTQHRNMPTKTILVAPPPPPPPEPVIIPTQTIIIAPSQLPTPPPPQIILAPSPAPPPPQIILTPSPVPVTHTRTHFHTHTVVVSPSAPPPKTQTQTVYVTPHQFHIKVEQPTKTVVQTRIEPTKTIIHQFTATNIDIPTGPEKERPEVVHKYEPPPFTKYHYYDYHNPKYEDHYEPPKYEPPKTERPKYEPPKHEPPAYEPPKYVPSTAPEPPRQERPKFTTPNPDYDYKYLYEYKYGDPDPEERATYSPRKETEMERPEMEKPKYEYDGKFVRVNPEIDTLVYKEKKNFTREQVAMEHDPDEYEGDHHRHHDKPMVTTQDDYYHHREKEVNGKPYGEEVMVRSGPNSNPEVTTKIYVDAEVDLRKPAVIVNGAVFPVTDSDVGKDVEQEIEKYSRYQPTKNVEKQIEKQVHQNVQQMAESFSGPPRFTATPHPHVVYERPNSLKELLRKLQASNMLPKTLTADNIDNSIKTLVRILDELKKRQKFVRPIVVTEGPGDYDEDDNEADDEDDIPNVISETYPSPGPEGGTPGTPGVDYPALSSIPPTTFNCKTQRYKGFFADPDTNCQVWHYCDLNGGQSSFLCPNGTIFSQVALTCDWWYNVKCSATPQLYVLNERLYKYIIPLAPKFPEDYSGPLVDKYLALKFQEMEEKMKKEKQEKAKKQKEKEKDDEKEKQEENSNLVPDSSPATPFRETLQTIEDDNNK
ncbi:unnamed protein product [Callosobruchus maculatus]|uniref:Chitin-binding type-2 domain-containing protein n=1 Tax=Callosobruchus maculatus TaxID=64391 RepID=A0A653BQW7_CALMS|nr:unnamed protein product [Callosobruchus maculatus]